jgi:hypothetical protein
LLPCCKYSASWIFSVSALHTPLADFVISALRAYAEFGGPTCIRIALAPAASTPLTFPVTAADTHFRSFPIFTLSLPPLLPAIGVPEEARLRRYSKSFGDSNAQIYIIHELSGLLIAYRQWGLP